MTTKNILFSILLLMAAGYVSAAQEVSVGVSDKAVDLCIKKFGDNNDECLAEISKKSDAALNQAYNKKLKSIESFDYSQWWMGSEGQKQQMIAKFQSSQKIWLNYRDVFCQAAVTGAQSTDNLGNEITRCILTMNERRIDEINFIKLNPAD